MTTIPVQNTIQQYVADGVTTVYNYPFLIPEDEDISVYVTLSGQNPNPTADLKTLNVDYSVQNAGVVNGGTVTFLTNHVPANDAYVTLMRNVTASIDTEFSTAANISGQNLDNAFERVILLIQQLYSLYMFRALSYVVDSYLPSPQQTNIVPVLTDVDRQIWISSGGEIIAAVLEEKPDVSVLRAELANDDNGTDGAGLVGYYDPFGARSWTLRTYLNTFSPTIYATGAGTANAITVTTPYIVNALYNGQKLEIKVLATNTSSSTIAFNGGPAVAIKVMDITGLQNTVANQMIAGGTYQFRYDSTETAWILLNPSTSIGHCVSTFIAHTQTIGNGVEATAEFDTASISDSTGLITFNSTTHEITVTKAGLYLISLRIGLDTNGSTPVGTVFGTVKVVGGSPIIETSEQYMNNSDINCTVSEPIRLAANTTLITTISNLTNHNCSTPSTNSQTDSNFSVAYLAA